MPIFRWKLDLCWLFENFCFYWDAWHDSNFENIWSTGSEVCRTSTHTTAVSADMILLVVCFHCSFSTVWHLLSSLMGHCPTWKGQSVQIMDQACPLVYQKSQKSTWYAYYCNATAWRALIWHQLIEWHKVPLRFENAWTHPHRGLCQSWSSVALIQLNHVLITCWMITHTTGSQYVVHT